MVGVIVARHRDHPAGGVGQVGAEGRVGGAAPGDLDGAAEPADLVEHGQAAAALQNDAVDQRAGQVLSAVAEIETDDGPAQQGVPQRALLARTQVWQQDGGVRGICPRRELDQPGRGQVPSEQAGQPGDGAAGGEQVHLHAPPAGLGQRRDQEPVRRVQDQPVGDAQDDVAGAGDVGYLARLADA